MELLEKETILWESKNKHLVLTTHRLREMYKSVVGSKIKSILLEEISSCELRTIRQFRFLRMAVLYFLVINGAVYLLNNFLFKAVLIKVLFDDVNIGPETAQLIFYFSITVALAYISMFILSVRKVFSFYSSGLTIDFQLRSLNFEERESFLSRVEHAMDKRRRGLYRND